MKLNRYINRIQSRGNTVDIEQGRLLPLLEQTDPSMPALEEGARANTPPPFLPEASLCHIRCGWDSYLNH